jgi:PadR family transcriptional regulator, regulatory protein PadR
VVRASTRNEHGETKRRRYTKRIGAQMWESQLRKGSLMLAVLATLRDGRLYGSEIRRRLEQIAGLTVAEGVIYPILRRLRKTNFLETEWINPVVGQPRTYFALTSRGHQYLAELSNTWNEFTGGMDRMLATPHRTHAEPPECDLATHSESPAEPLYKGATAADESLAASR